MSEVIDRMGPLAYKKLAQLMRNIAVAQSKGDSAKIAQVGWCWGCLLSRCCVLGMRLAGPCPPGVCMGAGAAAP
jgi:hypothetical protein